MILLAFMFGFLLLILRYRFARKRLRKLADSPLAGYDTGARSPYRVPHSVRFHKGL